jgi:hypothetical protein
MVGSARATGSTHFVFLLASHGCFGRVRVKEVLKHVSEESTPSVGVVSSLVAATRDGDGAMHRAVLDGVAAACGTTRVRRRRP